MENREKQREYFSIISAILIHIALLLLIPELRSEIAKPLSNENIMTIRANFIEVISEKENITEEKQVDSSSEKILKEKKELNYVKKSEKKLSNKTSTRTIKSEKIKYSEDMLPVINLNREKIKFNDYERSVEVKPNFDKTNYIGIKDDIIKEKNEKISLKDGNSNSTENGKVDNKKIELESKLVSDNGIGKGVIKSEKAEGTTVNKAGVTGGIKMQIIDGEGEAVWDKRNKEPEYPEKAQRNGWTGKVTLLLAVDAEGIVKQVLVEEKSGYFDIDISTEKAAKTWRIHIIRKGIRVAGKVRIPYSFDLRK